MRSPEPCFFSMPAVVCPRCSRSGKYFKLHGDLGVLYGCGWDDCSHSNYLAWSDLEALKATATHGEQEPS